MADSLARVASDLIAAAAAAPVAVVGVVKKGAVNVKKDWRANAQASSGRHAPAYPYSITFDVSATGRTVSAEIGPDKDKPQGPLGNLLEFGSVNNPPHLDGQRAIDAERPKFIEQIAKLARPW